jgi:ribosomal protein L35
MAKIKTHKGLSKRLKLTGAKKNKKIMHAPQNDNHHLRTKKTSLKKNRMSGDTALTKTDKSKVILKWF